VSWVAFQPSRLNLSSPPARSLALGQREASPKGDESGGLVSHGSFGPIVSISGFKEPRLKRLDLGGSRLGARQSVIDRETRVNPFQQQRLTVEYRRSTDSR